MKWVLSRLQRLSLATLLTGGVVAVAGVVVLVMAMEPPPGVAFGPEGTSATPSAGTADPSSAAPTPSASASDTPSAIVLTTPDAPPSASATARPTATPRPSATSTTTPLPSPAAAPPDCTASNLQVTLTSDRGVYRAGQAVTFTMTARNAGSSACRDQSNTCMDPVTVSDSNGNVVWTSTHPGAGMCAYPTSSNLAPGASVSYTYQWDQHACTSSACPGPPVPPGNYSAHGWWRVGTDNVGSNTINVTVAAA